MMYAPLIDFIKALYPDEAFIPLHQPRFIGNEKKYLLEAIDSTFVSSVGQYVDAFEERFAQKVGSRYAIACVNGTSALHIALIVAGVGRGDEVITQPLTFVATCNAINYVGATPIFVDVDRENMGLSPKALRHFLEQHCQIINGQCVNKTTQKTIKACLPMHSFGHPCTIDEIESICDQWHLSLIEDAAESLGSYYNDRHTGTFGKMGTFSFNGNKIITAGGGGCLVTDDEELAKRAKHLTTTAKIAHPFEYIHDEVGYNYRMPNLNAALLVAQLENLELFVASKRALAKQYEAFIKAIKGIDFIKEPARATSNYWLNGVVCQNRQDRDEFLNTFNANGIMTRPIWQLMNRLKMFENAQCDDLTNAQYLEDRVVNIPSSVVI